MEVANECDLGVFRKIYIQLTLAYIHTSYIHANSYIHTYCIRTYDVHTGMYIQTHFVYIMHLAECE